MHVERGQRTVATTSAFAWPSWTLASSEKPGSGRSVRNAARHRGIRTRVHGAQAQHHRESSCESGA